MAPATPAAAHGAPFGVAPLDRLIGPIPAGGTLALRHDPAVEAIPFLVESASRHLRSGAPVVYLVASRPPARVAEAVQAAAGADAARLVTIDAYSALVGGASDAQYVASRPEDLADVAAWLGHAARDHPNAVLLLESLDALVDRAGPERFRAHFPRLLEAMKRFRFSACLWAAWPYGPEMEKLLDRFDAVLSLKGVEERVVLNQLVSVARTPWSQVRAPPSLYRAVPPGGVVLHIPKVLVTGPYGAGKSTFVHAVSQSARSVERLGTTVALDRGTAELDGVQVELFGTPGQERFDALMPTLAGQAAGVVLVVDSSRPESFGRARAMLDKVWKRGLHAVVALNKQDLPGAMAFSDAAAALHLPDGVEVLPCTASDAASARKVLANLVGKVLGGAAA